VTGRKKERQLGEMGNRQKEKAEDLGQDWNYLAEKKKKTPEREKGTPVLRHGGQGGRIQLRPLWKLTKGEKRLVGKNRGNQAYLRIRA